ncbi:immunoglobulin gamma-1 heavy chain-like [Ahaetulla prasina]|uniref:immunoglobulin gamma-1 heavy chain-like n=1 Tax=Ahaetulla prasina TaxID=499056 RepID=UPI0026470C2A|nr:immunoglobulin gamma-1 heavy chain-like [Ahaetulla prasina]
MVIPGGSLRLTCKASGFNFTNYEMYWIRQSPGKGLEWVATVSRPEGTKQWYKSKVEGRFSISRDNSQTSAYLQMNNLKPEDSALFNSRRQSHSFFTMTSHSFILIMLAAFSKGGLSQVALTQSDAVLKKPGESHKLTCAVTGFNVNSYYMGWIRQKPSQGLEWLVSYYTSSSNYYSPTIQGRFLASKDSSNFYLQMNNLKAEDTAVYYCARDTVREILRDLMQKLFLSLLECLKRGHPRTTK